MELRDYQKDIIAKTRSNMRHGVRANLIQSPTGSGKTLLTAHMLKTAAEKGMASWFVVHRRELIKQSRDAFDGEGVKHGIIAANMDVAKTALIQIASVQTLARRFHKYRVPSLIVWDECHHIAANSWAKIFNSFPNAFHIGLTATPERMDGTGLGKWFRAMIEGPSVAWLIKNGYLAPYKLFAPGNIDLTGVRTRMGDYVGSELTSIVDRPSITGDAIKHYVKHASGRRAVVFCASIAHSKHVTQQFNDAGIVAEHVDGETDSSLRDQSIRRFKDGTTRILSNVELFGEGFDVPCIEAVVLLRPTKSLGLFLQQVGRSLRPSPGKQHAIILDHAGNCRLHGLPDEKRAWSLEGRSKAERKQPPVGLRICSECFGAQRRGPAECIYCGHIFEVESRKIQEIEGELSEVDILAYKKRKKSEQFGARTLHELIRLGTQRGYKSPYWWAVNVIKHRTERMVK